jgi:hypothetical protein
MTRRNKSIYQVNQEIPPETKLIVNDFVDKDIVTAKKRDAYKQLKHFPSVAEKLAKSSIYYRNWYYPEGKISHPHELWMHYVEKMFPYAAGGALLVDEPRTEAEFMDCEKKASVLRPLGYRYMIVTEHSEFYDLATELEDLDKKCLGTRR